MFYRRLVGNLCVTSNFIVDFEDTLTKNMTKNKNGTDKIIVKYIEEGGPFKQTHEHKIHIFFFWNKYHMLARN